MPYEKRRAPKSNEGGITENTRQEEKRSETNRNEE